MAPTREDLEKLLDEILQRPLHDVTLGQFSTFIQVLKQFFIAQREREDTTTIMQARIDPLRDEFIASLKKDGKISQGFQIPEGPWPTMLEDLAREHEKEKKLIQEFVASLKKDGKIDPGFQIPKGSWPTMLEDLARAREKMKMEDRQFEVREKTAE